MDPSQVFAISAAGMAVERTRVEVASLNLANAGTVQRPGGVGYQPLQTVVRPGGFISLLSGGMQAAALPEASVQPRDTGPRWVHEPGHPYANPQGFVAYAAVDTATEMVTLMSAMRSYEANVAAMNTAKVLVLKTLEIGRGQ